MQRLIKDRNIISPIKSLRIKRKIISQLRDKDGQRGKYKNKIRKFGIKRVNIQPVFQRIIGKRL